MKCLGKKYTVVNKTKSIGIHYKKPLYQSFYLNGLHLLYCLAVSLLLIAKCTINSKLFPHQMFSFSVGGLQYDAHAVKSTPVGIRVELKAGTFWTVKYFLLTHYTMQKQL